MKKRFSEEQIIGFLREAEAGMPVKDLCRRHGFSEASYYLWRSKFGGMSVPDAKRLKALEAENKTKGGIVIPDTAKEKPQEGKVVAVGKGKFSESGQLQALEVKAGDRVLYGKYSGSEITTKEGEELLIMKEDDILAIIK